MMKLLSFRSDRPTSALGVRRFAVVFGLTLLLAGCGGEEPQQEAAPPAAGGGPPPATVRVGQVRTQSLQKRVPVIGRLQEVRRVTVTAETAGKVLELAVDEGHRVTGDESVIARLDQTWAKLNLQAAEAAVAEAQADLDQADSDAQQLRQLLEAGSAREREAQDAQTLVAARRAQLDQAVAARDRAAVQSERAVVVAPFDGRISRKMVEAGQWVDPGDGLVEMISTGEIDAVVDVPERLVAGLEVGDEVQVRVDALDLEVTGKIVSIRPDGTTASRTFPVKVRLTDAEGRLKAGLSVTTQIPLSEQAEFITVPRNAVLYNATGAEVWYVAEMGGPQPAALAEPVEVLFGAGDRYVVQPLPGGQGPALTEGTRVVVEGAERLFPTRPLQILGGEQDPAVPAGDAAQGTTDSPAPASAAADPAA